MIYLGNNEIKSIHLGNTNIVSGFIGTFPFWGREEPVITINPNFDVYYQQDGENDWQLFDPALISLIDKIGVYNENNECIEIEIPADGKLPYTALTDANRVGFILKTPAEFDVALFKNSDFWEIDGVMTTAPWTRVYNSAEESIVPSGFERLLNLPDTVQRVEDYACAGFVVSLPDGQGGYEQNRLPSACTYIGDYAFSGAGLMQPPDEGAVFDIPARVTHIGEGAFAFSVMPSVINYNASGGVPANAFQSLTSDINLFNIAEGNTTIGDWAFQGNRIYDITIPEGVTSIGNFAFLAASTIAVDIEGEETYGTGITIPVTVTSLGESVFREGNIPALYFENPVPPTIGSDVFTDCIWTDPETGIDSPTPIYVPCESMDAYKAAWVEWADRIQCNAPDPSQEYFHFLSLQDGSQVLVITNRNLKYSLDGGTTWLDGDNELKTINNGEKIYFKAGNSSGGTAYGMFSGSSATTGVLEAKGNPMSLIYGDDFRDKTAMPTASTATTSVGFNGLFMGSTALTRADQMVLPATEITHSSYAGMFSGCTNLETAPPTINGAYKTSCYASMFYGCTSLITAPTITSNGYLAQSCCARMFFGCTALTNVQETLPGQRVATYCYEMMFYDCKSLVKAPALPATTFTPVSQPAVRCYAHMFAGCSSLNYIKMMSRDNPKNSYYHYCEGWVSGVASTGTFVKNANATWTTRGVDGIPNNWTVETASS